MTTLLLIQGPSVTDLQCYLQILEKIDIEFNDIKIKLQQSPDGKAFLSERKECDQYHVTLQNTLVKLRQRLDNISRLLLSVNNTTP